MKKGSTMKPKQKTHAANEMGRRFLLDVTKDGAVFIRERGTGPCPYGGLPVFSTDTRDEAEALQVRHCRLTDAGRAASEPAEIECRSCIGAGTIYDAPPRRRCLDCRGTGKVLDADRAVQS